MPCDPTASAAKRWRFFKILQVFAVSSGAAIVDWNALLTPAPHRGRDTHRLAILGDSAPGDIDAVLL
jgi:hypothetical protein